MQATSRDQATLPDREAVVDRYRYIRFAPWVASAAVVPVRPRLTALVPCPPVRSNAGQNQTFDPEVRRFLTWILAHVRIDLDHYRVGPLQRRLAACLRALHARSIAEAWERLEREPDLVSAAVGALLIGVTEFFREREVFDYLDAVLLPRLAAQGRGVRVWSAGCSDGAELYSVAMLLARRGWLADSTLLGTDCRAHAVEEAQRGWFPAARLAGLDPELRDAYFTAEGGGGRVCETLRRSVRWQQANIVEQRPDDRAPWDVILCRNVAIYLESAGAARMWSQVVRLLRPGGALVVGKAERPEWSPALVRLRPCVYEAAVMP